MSRKAPVFYDSFPRQLAFYAMTYARKNKLKAPPRIMSVIINSNEPGPVHPKLYTVEEQNAAYREFLCVAWLWQRTKEFYPGSMGQWSPLFPPALEL